MKQVVQDIRSGVTEVRTLPAPIAGQGQVVIATAASLISAGTERYVVDLARKSLLGKARERPDHVRRVLQKIRTEGLLLTAQQVRAKLDEPMPLGYSAAGVVLECGRGVQELKPGDRVATAAPHAGIIAASKMQCAKIPDGVTFEQAAYTSVAAIGLEGVRLARVTLGERVVVVGLGLIGQLVCAMLKAQGCKVFGVDIDPQKLERARAFGADATGIGTPRGEVMAFSDGKGVDAVILTAATPSNDPIEFAADVCRVRGRIVLVGVVGLQLPRAPFFAKELEFTVSGSLGPGRGDPFYEEIGQDYPVGYVRWTMQRNMEACLDLMASGRLPVEKLTTHRFSIDRAAEAYDLITEGKDPHVGIVLEYPAPPPTPARTITFKTSNNRKRVDGEVGVSFVGVGNFARLVMLPLVQKVAGVRFRGIASAKGMNAEHSARRVGFDYATTQFEELLEDRDTHAIFLATRHDLHAELVLQALRAGKNVFVEKPLCIREHELLAIDALLRELGDRAPVLTVGFNRRFAKATTILRDTFRAALPLSISYRFAPGPLAANAWPQIDDIGGGRIIGEACHAIDTCVAICGSPPVRVFAESVGPGGGSETTDDRVFITLRHEDGTVSSISYQAAGDRAAPPERIEVFGGGTTAYVESWGDVEIFRGEKRRVESGGRDKGFAQEFAAFIASCRKGSAWPIPWEHLYGTTWASMMAVRSLREGMPIARD